MPTPPCGRCALGSPPRPCDLATCMRDLGDANQDDVASGERCRQCAARPVACTCVIPLDPVEWPCDEPRPLAPSWCSGDDAYGDRCPYPATEPDHARKHSVLAVRRTPALSHWSAIAHAAECAGGDARVGAIYVARCCGLLFFGCRPHRERRGGHAVLGRCAARSQFCRRPSVQGHRRQRVRMGVPTALSRPDQ
nr:hypothetical protein [Pandoravirus belohorizontensis]